MRKRYKDFVCPNCFRQIIKCKCELYPNSLIRIDEGIQEHIRVLQDKGYRTIGCCEGHPPVCLEIYIAFAYDYDFQTLPEGFKYNPRRHTLSHKLYSIADKDELKGEKAEYLQNLMEWCSSLPYFANK